MKNVAVSLALIFAAQSAHAAPPIEAYGELPDIADVALSPDGRHFAYITREGGVDYFVVSRVGGEPIGIVKGGFKARSVSFIDSKHAIFFASDTISMAFYRGEWEHSGAISFNIETKEPKLLLKDTEDLHPAQTGLGRIVGRRRGANEVFMPAYSFNGASAAPYDLYSVDLDTGRGKRFAPGTSWTVDWFVDEDGAVVAREEFDEKSRTHRILRGRRGSIESIYEKKVDDLPVLSLIAVASDKAALIVGTRPDGEQFERLARLGFDGSLSPPLYSSEDRDVERVLADHNRVAIGVEFSGMTPKYSMNDATVDSIMKSAANAFPDASVRLVDWTDDMKKLLLFVEGGSRAPSYYVLNVSNKSMAQVARSYKRISDADVGAVNAIEFKARDGRKIPALLTSPPGVELGPKLPLIVMPHGGPEAYDSIGFDYMAQYFASRGYLVYQPNFRGSAGFGIDHLEAGYGEWGGKMQDDVTDGVNLLVKKGWADADRICIIGGSYGGYSALAGGAFTPDLYKCVAAIAPVADLNAMLNETVRDRGSKSQTYAYWTKLIGDKRADKAKIEAISPVNAAASFKAPVLLLHGSDDTIVPLSQSSKMEAALKKAGKNVKFIKLKGEDHWLSSGETRLQALKELDAFVAATIGRN